MNSPVFPTVSTARVSQIFGNYNPGIYGGDGKHKGIDFAVSAGTPVYACMDGTVIAVTNAGRTGYGRHIRILHPDGSMSIYGHLNSTLITEGAPVLAGMVIGMSGGDPADNVDGDGLSTGAHLHWEIRPVAALTGDQGAVDPVKYCLQYLPARISFAEVVATDALNVRSSPVNGQVLYTLRRNQGVAVIEIKEEWARLHALRPEWVGFRYLWMTGKEAIVMDSSVFSDTEKLKLLWDAHPDLHNARGF